MTPEKGIENGKYLPAVQNPILEKYIADIFRLLSDNTANTSNVTAPMANFRNFLNHFSSDEAGILSEITTVLGKEIHFDQIAQEKFSLDFLKKIDIHRMLQVISLTGVSGDLERAFIEIFRDKFANSLSDPQKTQFITELSAPRIDSFTVFLSGVETFKEGLGVEESGDDEAKLKAKAKAKSKLESGLENLSITNQELKDKLASNPALNLNIDGQSFAHWNPQIAHFFDMLTTKSIIDKSKENFNKVEGITNQIQDLFKKGPPLMETIFRRYPMNIAQLRDGDEELKKTIGDLGYRVKVAEEGGDVTTARSLEKKIDEYYWRAYFFKLKQENNQFGTILEKAFQADFDFSVLSGDEQVILFKELGNISLQHLNGFPNGESFVELIGANHDEFNAFYQDLFDLEHQEITLGGQTVRLEKKVVSRANTGLKSLDSMEGSDFLPLEYTLDVGALSLSPEERTSLNILFAGYLSEDKKTATFQGNDLGKLMYLFFVGNSAKPLTSLAEGKQKEITDFFEQQQDLLPKKSDFKEDLGENSLHEFYDSWRKLDGYDFPEDSKGEQANYGFKKGTSLWLSIGTSPLPPFEVGGDDFIQARIEEIDLANKTFKFKLYGGAVAFDKNKEGAEYQLPMDKESLENRKSKFGKIIKLPDPKDEDFSSYLKKYKDGGLDDNKVFDTIEWNGKSLVSKLADESGETQDSKVEYLGYVDHTNDNGEYERNNVFYKLEYHPDKTITISSEFEDGDKKLRSFSKRMTYDNFILFVTSKKLQPRSKSDYETAKKKLDDVESKKGRKWNRWSFKTIKNTIKGLWKKINDGMDKYQKDQEDKLHDFLVDDVGLWKIVGNVLGFIPSIGDAARQLDLEAFKERDTKIRKKIEERINKFTADPDFADFFEKKGTYMEMYLGEGMSLMDFVVSGQTVVNNDKLRPIMAAALVALIKKGKSPYRGMSGKITQGVWVKLLFGEAHHKRYLSHRKQMEEEIDNGGPRSKEYEDMLVNSEIDYILNNIRGSNPTGKDDKPLMGSSKSDQALKGLYSDAYTGALQEAYTGFTEKSSIEAEYSKMTHNNFDFAYEDFKKITSGRINVGLAGILKMGVLARSPNEKEKVKMALTYVMLSGVLKHCGGKSQKKWFEALGRSFSSFPPALLAQDPKHQSKALYLLNNATQTKGRFAQETGYHLSDFSSSSDNIPFKAFLGKFHDRWFKDNNAKEINAFFDTDLINKDWSTDPLLQAMQKKVKDNSDVNTNPEWDQNDTLTTDSLFRISRTNIGQMLDYKNNRFNGKDDDAKKDKKDFWEGVNRSLQSLSNSPENVKSVMQLFLSWFDDAGFSENNYPDLVRKLKTIKNYKDKTASGDFIGKLHKYNPITKKVEKFINEEGKTPTIGSVRSLDVENMMRYFFVGTVLDGKGQGEAPEHVHGALEKFKDYFYENIDTITSDSFIDEIFGAGLKKSPSYLLVGWDDYNNTVTSGGFDFGDFGGDATSKDDKKAKKAFYRDDNIYINKDLVALEKRLDSRKIKSAPKLTGTSTDIAGEEAEATLNGS